MVVGLLAAGQAQTVQRSMEVDLKGLAYVEFSAKRPVAVSKFSNVEPGKLYTFNFQDNTTTIQNNAAYLENGQSLCPTLGQTVLFYGQEDFTLRQVTRMLSDDAQVGGSARSVLRIETPQTVDLECVDALEFALPTAAAISSFKNMRRGKIYTFRFTNEHTTIVRDMAYLANGSNLTPPAGSTVVFVTDDGGTLRQVTRGTIDEPPDLIARRTTRYIDQPQSVDLTGVTTVEFALPTRGTITSFHNAEAGKIYTFRFANGNTTISRGGAFLANGVPLNPPAGSTLVFTGERSSEVRQVTPAPQNKSSVPPLLKNALVAVITLAILICWVREIRSRRQIPQTG